MRSDGQVKGTRVLAPNDEHKQQPAALISPLFSFNFYPIFAVLLPRAKGTVVLDGVGNWDADPSANRPARAALWPEIDDRFLSRP